MLQELDHQLQNQLFVDFGFNRLIVAENGVKQEGQQWGADHGLEIDALNVEDVEVIKGPAALEYGNEAIAGVIKINNNNLPAKHSLSGEAKALYQSINDNYCNWI